MVLCSLEEAWGTSSFNNLNNKSDNTEDSDDNRYRYDFSRDSRPLSEHNGCYRNPGKQKIIVENKKKTPVRKRYVPDHSSDEKYDDTDDHESYQNFESNDESSEGKYQPVEEDSEFENYETFNNDSNQENVYIEDEDNDMDDEFDAEENNENTSKNNKNEYYDNYQQDSEDDEGSGVNINMSLIMDKLNKLANMIEVSNKNGNNGMKDIFIFVIVGIFLIFILDLIFRIGQKMTK